VTGFGNVLDDIIRETERRGGGGDVLEEVLRETLRRSPGGGGLFDDLIREAQRSGAHQVPSVRELRELLGPTLGAVPSAALRALGLMRRMHPWLRALDLIDLARWLLEAPFQEVPALVAPPGWVVAARCPPWNNAEWVGVGTQSITPNFIWPVDCSWRGTGGPYGWNIAPSSMSVFVVQGRWNNTLQQHRHGHLMTLHRLGAPGRPAALSALDPRSGYRWLYQPARMRPFGAALGSRVLQFQQAADLARPLDQVAQQVRNIFARRADRLQPAQDARTQPDPSPWPQSQLVMQDRRGRPVELVIGPEAQVEVRPSTHAYRPPPPPGVRVRQYREKKLRATIPAAVATILNVTSEANDFVDALHKAIPEKYRSRGNRWDRMLPELYHHWDKIDWGQALQNLVMNQVEDWAIGTANRLANREANRAGWRGGMGAATMAQWAGGRSPATAYGRGR
jgi:hypothetical protein